MSVDAGLLPVFVLRPAPGNAATVARLADLGIAAVPLPLFVIQPVDWKPPSAGDFDALLLTSANALRMAGNGLMALRSLPVWCVGQSTAAAARGAGLSVARVGTGGVSALIDGSDDRLLWLCGADYSSLSGDDATRVATVPVYRACDLPFAVTRVAQPCIMLLHSSRAARRLAALTAERAHIALVTISGPVAAAAGTGWHSVAIASRPDDGEMVAIAAELCHKRP